MSDIIADLVRRAIDDGDAIGKVIYPEHVSFERVCLICAGAIHCAVDDRECDLPEEKAPTDNEVEAAYKQLLEYTWDRRGAKDQLDMFQQEPLWRGNAAHEARKDLE